VNIKSLLTLVRDLIEVLPTFGDAHWEDVESISGERPTVVLVTGFAATHRSLSILRKRLRRDGFDVLVLSLDWAALSDGVRGLYRMAERLSSLVLDLKKRRGKKGGKIYLVAHSAGGLVARYYVQLLGGWHYCDALITLATPHQGTWLAALGFFTHLILKARCLFQMLPISPFIRRLNRTAWPDGFHLVSIYSKDDMMCPSGASRFPILDQGRVLNQEVSGLSHSDFLLSKVSYQLLLQHLRSADDILAAIDA